jgi:hypothetical protein
VEHLRRLGEDARIVGKVTAGSRGVTFR